MVLGYRTVAFTVRYTGGSDDDLGTDVDNPGNEWIIIAAFSIILLLFTIVIVLILVGRREGGYIEE